MEPGRSLTRVPTAPTAPGAPRERVAKKQLPLFRPEGDADKGLRVDAVDEWARGALGSDRGGSGEVNWGKRTRYGGRAHRARRGITLIEVMLAVSVMSIALTSFIVGILSSSVATETSHEATIAQEAVRRMVETLQAADFTEVYALFNANGADDPDGAGTAPGNGFVVDGLQVLSGDADGLAGEIRFPTADKGGVLVLREDLVSTVFGTPRDLSGDGVVDDEDHSGDYQLLPVWVRVQWTGKSGPGKYETRTQLANY